MSKGRIQESECRRHAFGGVILIFWCGLFGKVVADGATGGILNRTAGVGSG